MSVITCGNCGAKNRVPAAASGTPRCGRCQNPLPWIVDAGDDNFADTADTADIPVLVDLWATWCRPCRMVSPALEQLAHEFAGRLKLVKVDIDNSQAVTTRFGVQAVPTLLVLIHGEVVAYRAGAAPIATLRQWVEQALGTARTPT